MLHYNLRNILILNLLHMIHKLLVVNLSHQIPDHIQNYDFDQ